MLNPDDFIITRKRKKYRFAHFANASNCFELEQWQPMIDRHYTVEVGAGTALFLVELAARYPDRHFVACDVKADRLQKGARLALERNISNIQFVRVRADQLDEVFRKGTVDEIWLTFSDPFPRDRHAKHRLSHPRFLSIYRELISADGVLKMKTDNHQLFDYSLEQFVAEKWQITELSYDLHESNFSDHYKIMTTYEKKFVALGLPIYFVSASKTHN